VRAILPVVILGFLLAACGETRHEPPPTRYRPPAYHPEQFPDIPLFPLNGYELDPNHEQLAIALAGGTVRRFEVSMILRAGASDDPPEAVLSRFDAELPAYGWIREGRGQWRKGAERLIIEAGRSGGLTTVRFHLRPAERP
jgi:hypothetical protein